jgi:hypothetical protein
MKVLYKYGILIIKTLSNATFQKKKIVCLQSSLLTLERVTASFKNRLKVEPIKRVTY